MSNYKTPGEEKLSNGRTLAELMRPVRGLVGVIVSPATPGGKPVNFNPHERKKIEIVVEPDGPNKKSVTLDQFTPVRITEALARASERYPAGDIESIRERTAMAFEELARLAGTDVKATAVPKVAAANVTSRMPQPPESDFEEVAADENFDEASAIASVNAGGQKAAKIHNQVSPLSVFGQKKQTVNNNLPPAAVKGQLIGPPQKLVYFEKEGIGTVSAFYHDVLVDIAPATDDEPVSGFIVLIYDLRFDQSAARWFPLANDPYRRPWAVLIKGFDVVYLVQTTGFQYVYDNREYCVLSIERAAPAD